MHVISSENFFSLQKSLPWMKIAFLRCLKNRLCRNVTTAHCTTFHVPASLMLSLSWEDIWTIQTHCMEYTLTYLIENLFNFNWYQIYVVDVMLCVCEHAQLPCTQNIGTVQALAHEKVFTPIIMCEWSEWWWVTISGSFKVFNGLM